MIVELAGPSGSGKSTIIKGLPAILSEKGLRVIATEEVRKVIVRRLFGQACLSDRLYQAIWQGLLAWEGLRFALEHLYLSKIALLSQCNRPVSLRIRLWILRGLFKQWGQYRVFRNYLNPNEVVIIDGGLIHFTIALFSSELEPPPAVLLQTYVQELPPSDLLIVIRVPISTCMERVMSRERMLSRRMQNLSPEAIFAFIRNQDGTIEQAVAEAQRNDWKSISIDNTMPLTQVIQQLRAKIEGQSWDLPHISFQS